MPEILSWDDIADSYSDTLVLGNGSSMAVDPAFDYATLLEKARAEAMITADVQKVFEYFGTEDFELVLRLLWDTHHVNAALGIDDPVTEKAYIEVRKALVTAVRAIHPPHERVSAQLNDIYMFMRRYNEVVSLNYDLLVYWAMLWGNESLGPWFKDCFIGGEFESEWSGLYSPYGAAKGATLVFYPHGNLVLARGVTEGEYKVARNDDWVPLLDRVIQEWESEGSIPLFVSEGKRAQKERAILRSPYLGTVYRSVLPTIGPSVTCYGWGMAPQDSHVLRQFRAAGVKRVAISVYTGRKDEEVEQDCGKIRLRVKRWLPKAEIVFYDSQSPGCWNNPRV